VDRETFMKAVQLAPQTRSGRYTILSEVTPELLQEAYDEVYGVSVSGDGEFAILTLHTFHTTIPCSMEEQYSLKQEGSDNP